MKDGDFPQLRRHLRELAECFPHSGDMTDSRLSSYFNVLKPFELGVIVKACRDLLADEDRKPQFPTAGELKRSARTYGDPNSDTFYMPCQHLAWIDGVRTECRNEIVVDGLNRFCPRHASDAVSGPPATREERIEVLRDASPKARAFLRSALPDLMADIPITDEERSQTALPAQSPLPNAIEHKLQGLPVAQAVAIRQNWPARPWPCHVCGEGYTSPVWHCRCDRHWGTDDAFCRSCGTAQTAIKGASG